MLSRTRPTEPAEVPDEAAVAEPAAAAAAAAAMAEEEDDDTAGGYEARDSNELPVSHEAVVKHGAKPIVAMDLDPSGSRLVTGSLDYKLQLWDFASMDVRMKAFRKLEPVEGAHVMQRVVVASLRLADVRHSFKASGRRRGRDLKKPG